jgi:hypothetical protein
MSGAEPAMKQAEALTERAIARDIWSASRKSV